MHLIALEVIGDQVGTIGKGQEFHVLNEDYAGYLIRTNRAKPYEKRWDGLDWRGATVVIIASGPSLSEEQCAAVEQWKQAGRGRVIVINTSFRRAPWADVIYGCDARWWETYEDEVRQTCTGSLWTQDAKCKGINRIESRAAKGLSKQVGIINQGNNGGYQAIGIAHQAGARKLVLLGYDMHAKGGSHWHGDHPANLNTKPHFNLWLDNFDVLAADLNAEGIEVLNATPKSAMRCFPSLDLADALK
jgi:hypothetical protein